MKTVCFRFLLALLSLITVSASVALPTSSKVMGPTPQDSVSIHLTLGNPSGATDNTSNKDNFLMVKVQYALSFNNTKGGPNWVSWHLQASDIGDQARGDFHPDDSLPA